MGNTKSLLAFACTSYSSIGQHSLAVQLIDFLNSHNLIIAFQMFGEIFVEDLTENGPFFNDKKVESRHGFVIGSSNAFPLFIITLCFILNSHSFGKFPYHGRCFLTISPFQQQIIYFILGKLICSMVL